jgi:hypothetical protein
MRVFDPLAQGFDALRIGQIRVGREAAESFADDMLRVDGSAKGHRRNAGDLGPLLLVGARAGQSCRGTHALEVLGGKGFSRPAHQHGHVRALASPVGVEFIEHQEAQVFCSFDEESFLGSGED